MDSFDSFAGANKPDCWQRLTGAQWHQILGVPGVRMSRPIKHGARVAIRFVVGKERPNMAVFNEDILLMPEY
jgi:hypothetical protein